MPNMSKINDSRFWNLWRASGALNVRQKPTMTLVAPVSPIVTISSPTVTNREVSLSVRDMGKDATPRWSVVDGAGKILARATSRAKARVISLQM